MRPEMIGAITGLALVLLVILGWCFNQALDIKANKEGLKEFKIAVEKELADIRLDLKDFKAHVEKTILALEARQDTTSKDIYQVMAEISRNLTTLMTAVSRIQGYTEGSKNGSNP
jgi:Skp family chaperone for outer membrane proteins